MGHQARWIRMMTVKAVIESFDRQLSANLMVSDDEQSRRNARFRRGWLWHARRDRVRYLRGG